MTKYLTDSQFHTHKYSSVSLKFLRENIKFLCLIKKLSKTQILHDGLLMKDILN